MSPLHLALSGLKRNIIRSVITILLFAFALGAIAYGFSYPFFGLENRYMNYLDQNGIKAVYFKENSQEQLTPEMLKEILPEGQSFYEIRESAEYWGDATLTFKSESVFDFTDERELDGYGFKMTEGTLPQKEDDLALSLAIYNVLRETGIKTLDMTLQEQHFTYKKFNTFEEAKKIFAERIPFSDEYLLKILPNYNLTGIVDTGAYYENAEKDLNLALDAAATGEEENEIGRRLNAIEENGTARLDFRVTEGVRAKSCKKYLTKIPSDQAAKSALFTKLRYLEEQNLLNIMLRKTNVRFAVVAEPEYDTLFSRGVSAAGTLFLILIPIGLVFLIVTFIMMIGLEATRLKAKRDEIATMRSIGMRSGKVYSISLIRTLLTAGISFVVSIGFAFLLQGLFAGLEGRHSKVYELLNFPIFLITFAGTAVLSFLSSTIAYRKYLKKMPAEIFRQNRS